MLDPNPQGPPVNDDEDLYRIVTVAAWVAEGVVSTAAFNSDWFSVDIVSRTSGPEESLGRVLGACAVIRFNCGCARGIGYDTRDELDANAPDNKAHAHVYNLASNNERKRRAARLRTACKPEIVLNRC